MYSICLLALLNFIQPKDIQTVKNELKPITIDKTLVTRHCEDILIEQALEYLAWRESRNTYNIISPTADYGKFQLNLYAHFYNPYGICYGINPQHFLNNPALQEKKARELMKLHIKILKQYNKPITYNRLVLSWSGIGYAIWN